MSSRTERAYPYDASTTVTSLVWDGPPSKYPGTHTDMHWQTWAKDGSLFVVDDDGENFGNEWNFAHLLRVVGVPPHHTVEEISLFPGLKRPGVDRFRYVNGAIAIDDRLYVAAYDYDWRDPRTGATTAWTLDGHVPVTSGSESYFVDAMSEHAGVAALMFSDDGGSTWANVPDADTPYFLGPRFAGLTFVSFGPGHSGVPDHLSPYVYAISNDQNWEGGDHLFLARVERDRILDRSAWEFWAGRGAGHWAVEPKWTPDEDAAQPIYTDYGFTGHSSMTWNPGLGRFLLAVGSDSAVHHWDVPGPVARETWHRRRELKILEATSPWGPWGLVHRDSSWEGDRVAYLPQLPAAWLSSDGRSGSLLFSGDYKFSFLPAELHLPKDENFYGFMTRPFRLVVNGDADD